MTVSPVNNNNTATPQRLPAGSSQDIFLKLLVAQLRTQNPLEPQKGTEFVTQIAQFNALEQLIAIRAGIDALRQASQPAPQPQS